MSPDDLQEGDILVKSGHIEIFSHFDEEGKQYAWTWGSIYEDEPTEKRSTRDNVLDQYDGIWRIEYEGCLD